MRVVCKEDGGVGTDVGGVVFPLWSLCLSLSLSLSLSRSRSLSLLASTTGRMEKCTAWESRLNQKVKSKNDELLAKENDIKDKDASLGQAVDDALGPIRTSSDGKKSKMKSAAAAPASLNADSEGITVEDVEDEDEDEDENEMMDESGDEERRRRRRRRLLHDDEEKEESDDQEAKRLYDQECHATNGHTLLDLGVVSHPTNE